MARSNPSDRHFERRRKAALARVHLPSVEELLRGMAFFSNDVLDDAAEYASRLSGFIRRKSLMGYEPLLAALDDLAMSPAREQIHRLDGEFEALSDDALLPITEGRRRCGVYLAMFGDIGAAVSMARDIAPLALDDLGAGNRSDLMWQALGWLLHARRLENWLETRGQFSFPHKHHRREVTRYAEEIRTAFENAAEPSPESESKKEPEPRAIPDERAAPSADEPATPAVVVFAELDKANNREGKDYLKEYREIVGVPLPLPILRDLVQVRSRLISEFPHAADVIDGILGGLTGRASTWIRPTILIGPAGCGKSRFAVRLAEELRLRFELFPCGGVADGMFGGNSRSWTSGMPSVPVTAVRRHMNAGPLMILDEIEKAGTGRHNGNLYDVLHGLLERETARRWQDPFLMAHCDLSHLSWLMTANAIEPIPTTLRDRCRCIRFPAPGPEHLIPLGQQILAARYEEKGFDPRWARPLDGQELEALSSVWQGGSIRVLQRLVEKIVDLREATMPRC